MESLRMKLTLASSCWCRGVCRGVESESERATGLGRRARETERSEKQVKKVKKCKGSHDLRNRCVIHRLRLTNSGCLRAEPPNPSSFLLHPSSPTNRGLV